MNLKQLEAFVEVAESGSFSKAAKRLFLTQPTVSAHILALEKELDIRLFVRNTKEVCLTEEGQRLYFYARQMADRQYKIKEEFGHRKTEEKQCIAIAASTVPAQYLLPELLAKSLVGSQSVASLHRTPVEKRTGRGISFYFINNL